MPAPHEDYTDLGDPRWAGLQAFFAAPAAARARRRTSRWLRVLAPAAVALVAVAVGLAVINGQKSDTVGVNRSAPVAASKAGGDDLTLGPLPATSEAGAGQVAGFAAQVDQFALVVLARARAASGAFQRFVIVRILKGDCPDVVRLRVADRPADEGRLQVLFLRPQMDGSAEISPAPAPVPSAAEATSTLDALAAGEPVIYSYQGHTALARELPAGTDPAAVQLP